MAIQLNQIYKCNICGNIVEVVHAGGGDLVCCGQKMELMEEKSQDQGYEKHVPVIEQTAKGIKVKVGETPHPMEANHYIEWIEIMFGLPAEALAKGGGKIGKKFLNLEDAPEAYFEFQETPANITARAYCNIHGLWKAEN